MTLRESDIIPGRHYLCRISFRKYEPSLMVLMRTEDGAWCVIAPGVCYQYEAAEVEPLRELDLEALAANREAQQLADLRALDRVNQQHTANVLGQLYAAQEIASRAIAAAESGDADTDDLLAALQDIADGADPPPLESAESPAVPFVLRFDVEGGHFLDFASLMAEQPTKRYVELVHALGDVSLGLAELFDLITGWEPTS